MNVDRQNRDALVDAMGRYLSGEITAFDLDDEIFRISECSTDATIEYAALALRSLYDELPDDQVEFSQEQSDYCQRLILLLQSNAYVEVQKRRRWSMTQLVAGIGLLAFLAGAAQLGWGYRLVALAVPFGLASMVLARLRRGRWSVQPESAGVALTLSSGVLELLAVRHRVTDFAKDQRPESRPGRQIRLTWANAILLVPIYAAWLILSPVVLLLQMLPITEIQTRVVAS